MPTYVSYHINLRDYELEASVSESSSGGAADGQKWNKVSFEYIDDVSDIIPRTAEFYNRVAEHLNSYDLMRAFRDGFIYGNEQSVPEGFYSMWGIVIEALGEDAKNVVSSVIVDVKEAMVLTGEPILGAGGGSTDYYNYSITFGFDEYPTAFSIMINNVTHATGGFPLEYLGDSVAYYDAIVTAIENVLTSLSIAWDSISYTTSEYGSCTLSILGSDSDQIQALELQHVWLVTSAPSASESSSDSNPVLESSSELVVFNMTTVSVSTSESSSTVLGEREDIHIDAKLVLRYVHLKGVTENAEQYYISNPIAEAATLSLSPNSSEGNNLVPDPFDTRRGESSSTGILTYLKDQGAVGLAPIGNIPPDDDWWLVWFIEVDDLSTLTDAYYGIQLKSLNFDIYYKLSSRASSNVVEVAKP